MLDSLKQKKLNIALAWCTVNRGQLRKIKVFVGLCSVVLLFVELIFTILLHHFIKIQ